MMWCSVELCDVMWRIFDVMWRDVMWCSVACRVEGGHESWCISLGGQAGVK